jgi:hypothetical protein
MTVDTGPTDSGPDAELLAVGDARSRVFGLVRASYGPQNDPKKSSTKTVRQTGWGCSYR